MCIVPMYNEGVHRYTHQKKNEPKTLYSDAKILHVDIVFYFISIHNKIR